MDKCDGEINLSDLLLEETPLLDRGDVHYVHLPSSKNKAIYRQDLHENLFRLLNVVKIDREFLQRQIETLTNDNDIANDFNVFESGNYESLAGVIECSLRIASIDEEVTLKDVFDASSQTLKNDLESLSNCFSPLPANEWEIEGPVIPHRISNTAFSAYATDVEALCEQYETDFGGKREESFDFKSLELFESFCEYPISSPTSIKSLDNDEKENNCDVSLEIQHEIIQVCDSLNDRQISSSQMIKLKLRDPACVVEDEGEVQGSSLEIVYDGPINYANTSGDAASLFSLSLEPGKTTPELTDSTSDVSVNGEVITDIYVDDDDDIEPSRDRLPDCRLTEKDTFNYTKVPVMQDDVINNLAAIKSGRNVLIDPENVKGESSREKGFEIFLNKAEKCDAEVKKDSKIVRNSTSFQEIAVKPKEVEAKISFAQLVRERFGWNNNISNNCKTLKAPADNLKGEELKKDDVLSPSENDGNNKLRTDRFENFSNKPEKGHTKVKKDSKTVKNSTSFQEIAVKPREVEAKISFAQLVRERFGWNNNNNNCKTLKTAADNLKGEELKKDDVLSPSENDGNNKLCTDRFENFSNKPEKGHPEVKKDSKTVINSTFQEMAVKSEEVYEQLRKYREFEAKIPFAQLVRERFGWDNDNCKTVKDPAENLKVAEAKNDDVLRPPELDGNSKLSINNSENLNVDSKAQRSSNEVEIKATKLNGEQKNIFSENFSGARENILAKFNDWVIDIDWVDDEEAEGAITPSFSDSSDSYHSSSLQTNALEGKDEAPAINSDASVSDYRKLSKNWVFKEELVPNANDCQASSKFDAFMKLRQDVLPKLKLTGGSNSKIPSKKRKINTDEEMSVKQPSVLQISSSPPRDAFEQKPANVHSEMKRANKLPDCSPVKIIGSSDTSKEAELISLLELRYNLRIVVRECGAEVPTRNEMFCVPDFIIDEKSAVILFPLRNLNISQQFLKLKKKINALSLRHSILYVLLVDKTNKDPCVHPDVLKMYSKLSGLATHLNMVVKDYTIKLLICKDLEEAARYLRRFVDFSLQNNNSQGCEVFQKREWLLPTQSLHETFLSNFPTLSSFHAQMMLADAPLRSLMKMSVEELRNAFPNIPEKCLTGFHKLAHVKLVLKPDEHNILNKIEDDVECQSLTPVVTVTDEFPKANPKRFKFKNLANMNCSNQLNLSNHVSAQPSNQNFQASSQVFNTYVTNNYSSFAEIRQEAFSPANAQFKSSQSPLHFPQRNDTRANRFSALTANDGWIQNANYSAADFNPRTEPSSYSARPNLNAFENITANPLPRQPSIPLSWQRYNSEFKY